jgi:hypothetical protein
MELLRQETCLACPHDKGRGHIPAVFVFDQGPALENRMSVPAHEMRPGPRSGKAAELFRTDRDKGYPGNIQQGTGVLGSAVISALHAQQASADQDRSF